MATLGIGLEESPVRLPATLLAFVSAAFCIGGR